MDLDGNGVFSVDEVIEVLPIDVHPGLKIINNPRVKIIKSDMEIEEAQALLEPEYDIFMNTVKVRSKLLFTRDILEKALDMERDEVIERVVVKEPESFEQTEDVVVG